MEENTLNLLERPEYSFLKTDPHLGKNIIFLTYGGSYAYGTNVEGSDIDIRGCALNSNAREHTSLPEVPDLARIEAFQMEVNERVVRDEI